MPSDIGLMPTSQLQQSQGYSNISTIHNPTLTPPSNEKF